MEKQEKIILELYSKEFMDSLSLPLFPEGRFWLYQTTIDGQQRFLEILSRNNAWCFLLPKELKIKGETDMCIEIKRNHIYEITDESQQALLLISRVYEKRNFKYKMVQINDDSLHIGRSPDSEIQYDNPLVSLHHAILERHKLGWYICDIRSKNGVYVNRKRIIKSYIKVGDVIDIYGLKFIAAPSGILMNTIKNVHVHIENQTIIENEKTSVVEPIETKSIHIAPYRCLPYNTVMMEIEGPPKVTIKDELPMIYLLGPSITMGLSSISMAVYSLYNAILNKQNITQIAPTILMAISMSLGTILWPILSKRYERIQKKKQEAHRIKKYSQYLQNVQVEIKEVIEQQCKLLCATYPLQYTMNELCGTDLLWSRKSGDDSFLTCILGKGNARADIAFTYPKENFQLHEDELYLKMKKIVSQNYELTGVPIVLKLTEKHRVGITGDSGICEQLMIQFIYQIVYFHSYQHVKIICLIEPSLLRKYHIPYLPHLFSEDRSIRFIVHDKKDGKRVHQHLEELKELEKDKDMPYYVIFCLLKDTQIISLIMEGLETVSQILVLHYARYKAELPAYCEEILHIDDKTQTLRFETGQIAQLNVQQMSNIANDFLRLANMYLPEEQAAKFPEELSILDLFACGNIQQLHILQRWQKADIVHSLETPIGIHETGEVLLLDAHENYHGPHGLLAGMTGSGKSESILTYIISLAINYAPTDVSFLLIDYKGGSMAKAFEKLPHVAGIITNLDQGSMQRSLAAIQSEVTRRQKLFAEISKTYDKSNIDIDKYRSLCHEHKEMQTVSHLFIIADEFAELKALQPQFLDCLKQTARIGRSLGIHLLLATQKPSGVVDDQIWSNSRFHLCLRVQDRSDSQDMLKREDAAYIRRTGLFYFQVGNNEVFKKGLSAWSQAPYEPKDFYVKRKNEEITVIDHTGQVVRSRGNNQKDKKLKITQLDAIVSYIADLALAQRMKAEPIWKEELPETLSIKDLTQVYGKHIGLVGCVDDVYHQSQFPMSIVIETLQHMVLYGQTHSGKEQFLETMLISWIADYDSDVLSIIVVNCEDTNYKRLQSASLVVDVLFAEDKEKIESMFVQVMLEIKKRKMGLSNTYQNIILIIHNFERFHELYEANDYDLQYILREGEKYHIFIILTLNNVNSLSYRFSQYIDKNIMFQVKEQSDYRLCFAQHNGLYPIHKKGSGIFENKEIFLFQTAIYEEDEIEKILTMKQGINAFQIPVLPKRVKHSIDGREKKVFIGLDVFTKEEVYMNWQYHFIYILGSYTLFLPYLKLLIRQLFVMKDITVLHIKESMNDKNILDVVESSKRTGKSLVILWQYFQNHTEVISSTLLAQLIEDEQITHIIIETMNGLNTYTMYEWFASSLIEACILWMGNGFLDHQYFLKRTANDLQNNLYKNRAYLWEEEQCKELQLWEEE